MELLNDIRKFIEELHSMPFETKQIGIDIEKTKFLMFYCRIKISRKIRELFCETLSGCLVATSSPEGRAKSKPVSHSLGSYSLASHSGRGVTQ